MNRRYIIPLLCAGALAFACGPRTHSSEAAASTPHERTAESAPLASSLGVTVDNGVDLAFHVTNAADRHVELDFPSGQLYDFVVLDSLGREVWRWSRGHMFTQTLQNRLLSSGETLSWEERWDHPGRHGAYTAVALLRSSNYPVEKRVAFRVP